MKHLIKLLKDWTDSTGKLWKAGTVVEIPDAVVAAELLIKDIGVKFSGIESVPGADPEAVTKAVDAAVQKSLASDETLKKLGDITAAKIHSISVKDNSDNDPSWGFMPPTIREPTEAQKQFAMGQFAGEVYLAGRDGRGASDRLAKCHERSQEIVKKGIDAGYINKTTVVQARVDADMGFAMPPVLNTMLLDTAAETAVVRPRCSVIPLSSLAVELPMVKDYDRSSSTVHGGLIAYWKGEDAQLTESKPAMEDVKLSLNALTILAFASHQAMKFAPFDLGGYLLPKMGDAVTFKEEDGFIRGTGAGMPLGLLNSLCKTSVAIESGQTLAKSALVTENVFKMEATLKVMRPGSVVWLYNRPELLRWLRLLTFDVGTGGEMARLFVGNPFSQDATLDGAPILDSEHMPAAGTVGDLTLADLSDYLIADDRSGAEVAQSMHLGFDYGRMAYRIIKYVDGQPMHRSTFTRHKGAGGLATTVTLAVRS